MGHSKFLGKRRSLVGFKPLGWAIGCGVALTGCTGATQPVDPIIPDGTAVVTPTPTISASPTPSLSPTPSPSIVASPPTITSPTVSPSFSPAKPEATVKLEQQVSDLMTKTANLTVRSVTCPADVSETAGKTYDCQVQSEVGEFIVVVQPTGQPGKFRWGTKKLLILSKLDALIQRSVASGGGKVTVDCGAPARIVNQGETFDCKLTDAKGKARIARITVRDEVGNVYVTVL